MINLEELREVKTIVTHEGCADGIASALILRDVLPDARVVFVQYGAPAWLGLVAEPRMLFCDMTPPPERVQEFVGEGAIVLDHHRGAREIVEAFGGRGVFADESAEPGVSGAMLAYRHVWIPLMEKICMGREGIAGWRELRQSVSRLAGLAGIRDTWQRDDPEWRAACAQAAALRFWPVDRLLSGGLENLEKHLEIGETLLRKDEERDEQSMSEAYRFTVGGVRVVAFEGLHTSDIAERLENEADLVLGWHYRHGGREGEMVVSCRSRGAFSALDLAKAHGGGGHTQAAGFTLRCPDGDPWSLLRCIVGARWVASGMPAKCPE